MAFSIKNPDTDRLAREVSRLTGESLTDAVANALKERLERLRAHRRKRRLRDELMEIGRRCSQLPLLDERSQEEIIGYDDSGLPR